MKSKRWILGAVFIIVAWLVLMVGASYLGYQHKSPVRIENWKPDAAR